MLARRLTDSRGPQRSRSRVVRYRTVSAFLADYDRNLSRGSVFLNGRQQLRVGARVRLTIALGRTSLRNIQGRVTRTAAFGNAVNEAPGMHIEILDGGRLQKIAARIRADSTSHAL